MRPMFAPKDLLDLSQFPFPELFADCPFAWDALPKIGAFLKQHLQPGNHGTVIGTPYIADDVWIGAGTVIEHGAVIKGPAIIGKNCEIRSSAYVRGNLIAGDNCVLGNASEFKNAVLFNGAQVPHFSYVGDSILGFQAHIGAGVILSNLKSSKGNIVVDGQATKLRKFGAILGDHADVGCNCVLNPGSVIGRGSVLYPNVLWRGVCPPHSIVKLRQAHEVVVRRQPTP